MSLMGQTPAPAAPAPVAPAAAPPTPELLQVGVVYILPMSQGMDQFLASRLTRKGALQVTSDPSKADAVLTDRLGKPLEMKLEELYPKAHPEVEAMPKPEPSETGEIPAAPLELKGGREATSTSTGGRGGRGNVFLVHRGSRNVIWSTFVPPSTSRAKDLDDAAGEITDRLLDDIKKLRKLSMPAPAGN